MYLRTQQQERKMTLLYFLVACPHALFLIAKAIAHARALNSARADNTITTHECE
jgi:hypothetical protein